MKGKEVKKGDLGEDEVTVPCSHVVQGGASVEKRRRARVEGHRQNRNTKQEKEKKDRITIIEGGGIEEEFCVELEEGLCVELEEDFCVELEEEFCVELEEEFCVELEEGLCVISPVWQGGRLCRVS